MAIKTQTDYAGRANCLYQSRGNITGGGATNFSSDDNGVALAGTTLNVAATYWYSIPVRGLSALDVVVKFGAITGAVTARILRIASDNASIKEVGAAFSPAVAASTLCLAKQATLTGDEYIVLEIVIPAAGSAAIVLAEYSGR